MDTNVKRELEDLSRLIEALQRGIAAQAAEIDRLQQQLDSARMSAGRSVAEDSLVRRFGFHAA